MRIEDEIKIIAKEFKISEPEIKKVIGYKISKKVNKNNKKLNLNTERKKHKIDNTILTQDIKHTNTNKYFFFTEGGYNQLIKKISEIENRIAFLGIEIGESCEESETFHDNFAYEEGTRQQHMWIKHLKQYEKIKNNIKVVSEKDKPSHIVSIGKRVMIEDLSSKKKRTFKIGGYICFSSHEMSYTSPIAAMIIGAKEGEIKNGIIEGILKEIKIVKVFDD